MLAMFFSTKMVTLFFDLTQTSTKGLLIEATTNDKIFYQK